MLRAFLSSVTLLLLCSACTHAQDIVSFKISKPYCLLNFMETCKGDPNASHGLVNAIDKAAIKDDTAFKHILEGYCNLTLDYNYPREQFPENRLRSRYGHIFDMIVIAAVQSEDLAQFKEKTVGLLPNSDQRQLFQLLQQAMPYYDKLVWQHQHQALELQLKKLKTYQHSISTLFNQLNHFYHGSWTQDMPFFIAIYPVPGKRSGTAATPHNNSLCVGIRDGDTDFDGIAGVVLHEMCHSLYNEQAAAVQYYIDSIFIQDTDMYHTLAYSYIDEGLATACGNGWAREILNGSPDKEEWYHDKYVNGYGHALYPIVKTYLANGQELDRTFIRKAIDTFAAVFPDAPYDYDLLLSNINLYSDAEIPAEKTSLTNIIRQYFHVISNSSLSPILDPESINQLKHSKGTQLIIVNKNTAANMEKIRDIFPELKRLLKNHSDEAYTATFYDTQKRPVILINANTEAEVADALKLLDKQKNMSATPQYYTLK